MSTFYYADDENPIVPHQNLWSFLLQDEPLSDWDYSGDTVPLAPASELVCHWCERSYLDCTCMEGDE